jgi:ABC-type enterobactin transport system permease subunit
VVLLVAPVTAYCGPVAFIGLIVSHFALAITGTALPASQRCACFGWRASGDLAAALLSSHAGATVDAWLARS